MTCDIAWFAGDTFSAADILMSFPVEAAASPVSAGRLGSGAVLRPVRRGLQAIAPCQCTQ